MKHPVVARYDALKRRICYLQFASNFCFYSTVLLGWAAIFCLNLWYALGSVVCILAATRLDRLAVDANIKLAEGE